MVGAGFIPARKGCDHLQRRQVGTHWVDDEVFSEDTLTSDLELFFSEQEEEGEVEEEEKDDEKEQEEEKPPE